MFSHYLDLLVKPTEVRIENKSEQMFKLGQKTIVQCQVIGSKPSAKITWFRGTEELILPKHNVYNDSLVTAQPDFVSELSRNLNTWTSVSYLTFVPKLTDNQRPLTCQAQNLKLQNSPAMSDSIVMNVQCECFHQFIFSPSLSCRHYHLTLDTKPNKK